MEQDPNKRRSPAKKSQTFYLHKDVIERFNQLAAASLYTKTDLINYWIESEYERQRAAGNLAPRWRPFDEAPPTPPASHSKKKSK